MKRGKAEYLTLVRGCILNPPLKWLTMSSKTVASAPNLDSHLPFWSPIAKRRGYITKTAIYLQYHLCVAQQAPGFTSESRLLKRPKAIGLVRYLDRY